MDAKCELCRKAFSSRRALSGRHRGGGSPQRFCSQRCKLTAWRRKNQKACREWDRQWKAAHRDERAVQWARWKAKNHSHQKDRRLRLALSVCDDPVWREIREALYLWRRHLHTQETDRVGQE